MEPPKVFISYSHDSASHKQWVLEFSTILRHRGVDAILDQWELKPGDDLPEFMEKNLSESDWAIMVCTKNYVEKANDGKGGVGYEKMIMTASSLSKISNSMVIPVIREKGEPITPTFLTTKIYIDFSKDSDFEFSMDNLLRTILKEPLYKKPTIGSNPFDGKESLEIRKSSDGMREVMKIISQEFDKTHYEWVYFKSLLEKTSMRRIAFDRYLREAEEKELIIIKTSTGGALGKAISVTNAGIDYLEKESLVEF